MNGIVIFIFILVSLNQLILLVNKDNNSGPCYTSDDCFIDVICGQTFVSVMLVFFSRCLINLSFCFPFVYPFCSQSYMQFLLIEVFERCNNTINSFWWFWPMNGLPCQSHHHISTTKISVKYFAADAEEE